jgi:exopolyphosphatase/guanosine-5'-triphosphate,3'-diphosphate pyrophosphatase
LQDKRVTELPIFAALDLGSNSFHLLLASFKSGKMTCMDRYKDVVRLASGINDKGFLSDDIMQEAFNSLPKFAERIRHIPKARVRVIGTNALRMAKNSDAFLHKAEAILGVPIDIISGAEEARLIYLGVAKDFTPGDKRRLVIDIGGGSTELVLGSVEPETVESLYMGCVSYMKRFFPDGKLSKKQYQAAVIAARAECQSIAPLLFGQPWDEVVGASGTICAVHNLCEELFHRPTITLAHIKSIAEMIYNEKHFKDINLLGLPPDRKPVLPAGLAILQGVFEELQIDEMISSEYTIREGVVHELAGRVYHQDRRELTIMQMMKNYHVDQAQAARVQQLAIKLFDQTKEQFVSTVSSPEGLLSWAASLHEIGLQISHSGYHKHGAYILANADMPGFSRQDQRLLSQLVLNHRRKIKLADSSYGANPDWHLFVILRLACLFNRRRTAQAQPEIGLRFDENEIHVRLSEEWLANHSLTNEDLENEKELLRAAGFKFFVKTS